MSLLLQASAPGTAVRVQQTAALAYANPVRELTALLPATWEQMLAFGGRQETITGFALLMAAGVFVALLGHESLTERVGRRLGGAALLFSGGCLLSTALPIGVGLSTLGYIFSRTLAFATLLQLLSGWVWGVYVGCLIKRAHRGGAGMAWLWSARLLAALIVLGIIASILVSQLRLVPRFSTYAREWDARHACIIDLRDSGQRDILIAPYSYDLSAYVSSRGLPMAQRSAYFYRVDSLRFSDAPHC